MKKILLGLLLLSTLFAQAQKKKSAKKSTKKADTTAVQEVEMVMEVSKDEEVRIEEVRVVEDVPTAGIAVMAAEEPVREGRNFDGDEAYYIHNSYRDRNLVIAYKGNDYDNRRYALLEYFSKKKITPFIFENISYSSYEGEKAQVKLNGKYGVIDLKGKMIIPCIYDEMSTVTIDGQIYFIVNKNSRQGVINDQNEVVIPFEYDNINRSYSSVIHLVVTKGNRSGVLNFVSRKMIIPLQYDHIEVLGSSNLIKVKRGNEFTLFNMTGEQVFNNWYQRLDINDDQTVMADQKGKKGLITLAEKKITPFEYDALERVYGSGPRYLYTAQKAGKYGVIGTDGKIVVPLQYDQLSNPRGDLFIVTKNMKKGLVAFDGRQVLSLEYDEISYTDKYFLVRKNGKTGIANREGAIILPVEYDVLSNAYISNEYNSTVFVGAKNGKKGMVDAVLGKARLEFIYDDIIGTRRSSYNSTESFNNTIIAVKNGKYGMIELNGNVVVPFEYDDLQYLNSFIVIAKKNGKYGIRDIYNGTNILLPFEYEFVNHKNNVIIAYKDAYERYRLSGSKIIRAE
jgi:hypothetical protein